MFIYLLLKRIICGILSLLCLAGTVLELLEIHLWSTKSKEENINVQNGTVLHGDNSIHDDKDILVQNDSLSPSVEFVPRQQRKYMILLSYYS